MQNNMANASRAGFFICLLVAAVPAQSFNIGDAFKQVADEIQRQLPKDSAKPERNQVTNQGLNEGIYQVPPAHLVDSDKVLWHYRQSTNEIVDAQIHFLKALDLKTEAAMLEAEAVALGNTSIGTRELKKITVRSIEANNAIRNKIDQRGRLSGRKREEFGQGLLPYANGIRELTLVNKRIHTLEEDVRRGWASGDFELIKKSTSVVAFLLGNLKPYMGSVFTTSKSVWGYAKSNEVETPAEPTGAFEDL